MGEVFRAYDTKTERRVALKVLPADLGADSEFQSRFERESRIVARLVSPHIIPIHGYGVVEGRPYIDMRLVEGSDLATRIRELGPFDPTTAVSVVKQTAEALDAAHEQSVLHRDVKPSNVLLAEQGKGVFVYLTDFGIAKSSHSHTSPTTASGFVVGTVGYMAPERFAGSSDSVASDIYSLACLLYEALTGEQPFVAGSPAALMHAHLYVPPPRPSERVTGIPVELDSVVARGLAKEPSERYRSAGELSAAAVAALRSTPSLSTSGEADISGVLPARPQASISTWTGPRSQAEESTTILGSASSPKGRKARQYIDQLLAPSTSPDFADFPLRAGFRFVHEPLGLEHEYVANLGHASYRHMLVNRIARSDGGAILVGGFRGVGKTTLIENVLNRLEVESHNRTYITLRISLARALSSEELLFTIVRQLFEKLEERDIIERLPRKVASKVLLAYIRTSMLVARKRSDTSEKTIASGLSASFASLAGLSPKLDRTVKTSLTTATEASFLAYTDTDAEHDFLRIVRILRSSPIPKRGLWSRLRGSVDPPIHLVVALDEIDKLTVTDDGQQEFDYLLSTLKNVLTSSGMHALFVAGVDLLDVAARDAGRGLGLFESVFAWNLYVPCLWQAPSDLISDLAPRDSENRRLYAVDRYLRYRGRGLPRRIFQQLNRLVRIDGDEARLVVDVSERQIFSLHVALGELLNRFLGPHAGENYSSLDDDRVRLSAYYALDWILDRPRAVFGVDDIIRGERAISHLLRADVAEVTRLLEFLEKNGVLEQLSESDSLQTVISPALGAPARRFKLSEVLRDRISQPISASHVSARLNSKHDRSESDELVLERYRLGGAVGADSLSVVYSAFDVKLRTRVAVRVVSAAVDEEDAVLRQYRARTEAVRSLSPHGLAAVIDVAVDSAVLIIATEWIEGVVLSRTVNPWSGPLAVTIALGILHTAAQLHESGITGLNLKPSKIVVRPDGGAVLTDVDLGPIDGRIKPTTPRYCPPDHDTVKSDSSSDVYAIAAILFEMLRGRNAKIISLPDRVGDRWSVSSLAVSVELRAILDQALHPREAQRFFTARAMIADLLLTPENRGEPLGDTAPGHAEDESFADATSRRRRPPEPPATERVRRKEK